MKWVALLIGALLVCQAGVAQSRRPRAKAQTPAPQSAGVELAAEPHFKQLVSAEQTHVYRLDVPPGEATALHRHQRDYIMIFLTDAEFRIELGDGKSETRQMSAGQMEVIKIPVVHRLVNAGTAPARALIVELVGGFHPENIVCGMGKRSCRSETGDLSDKAQQYTVSGLFETDVVRVREITIGAGAATPLLAGKYSRLLVPRSGNLDLRVTTDGKEEVFRIPGDEVRWLPSGPDIMLSNSAADEARFYQIEFK